MMWLVVVLVVLIVGAAFVFLLGLATSARVGDEVEPLRRDQYPPW